MTVPEKELQDELAKQRRDLNRGDMDAWAVCQKEIDRLVTLIVSGPPAP